MEIYGSEITECRVEDMVPGNYYYSQNPYRGRDIVLPLDTEGNIAVFTTQEAGYYALHEVTTCDKREVSKVRKVDGCRLAWRKAWGSGISYSLTVLTPNSRTPERSDMLMNWTDAVTVLVKSYEVLHLGVLYLSCLGALILRQGCIHLRWLDEGVFPVLEKAGYMEGWDVLEY